MEKWVVISISLVVSSVALYLFVRKSKDVGLPVDIQNLAMFLPPVLFLGVYNVWQEKSFAISWTNFFILFVNALFFSWLGNLASLKALEKAPNPGYSLVISKSYVLMTSILSVWIFGSELTARSVVAIIMIVIFLAVIIIGKKKNISEQNKSWILFSVGAFLAWGFQTFILKYLTNEGLESTVMLFYLMLFVSILISAQLVFKKVKVKLPRNHVPMFWAIGIASTFFNLFIILGYKYAPNPGYINAANAGSIALVTFFSALLFKDDLNIKKVIGVIGVIGSLILLFV